MSGPIFGSSSALGGSSGGNRHLVEFRAGRMNLVNKMVHPDTRKGLVYVYQAEDGLIHFCWKDRTSGNVEDDLIVFPDDCEFKKIENVKSGRVYLMKFKSSSKRLFFWMQEPKTDKDEEWCRRINEVINHPPSTSSLGSGRGGGTDNGDLQYMLNNMSQQQLMQLFGGVGQMGGLSNLLGSMNRPSSGNSSSRTSATSPASRTTLTSSTAGTGAAVTTPTTATTLPSTPRAPRKPATSDNKSSTTTPSTTGNNDNSRVLLSELQSYLAGINPGTTASTAATNRRQVDLSTAVNSDSLNSILSNPDCVKELETHLPEIEGDENKKQQLKDTLSSPQFQQALSMFSSALQSGQLGPVVSQFQLSNEAVAAANTGDLEQFIKALEKQVESVKTESTKTANPASTTAATPAAAAGDAKTDEENGHKKEKQNDDDEMTLG